MKRSKERQGSTLDVRFNEVYSRTSPYGHLSDTDTSPIRTVSYVPTKFSYISSKKTLYDTDPLKYGQRTQNLGPWEQILTNLTSLLRTLHGPGVDNLRYVPFPVGGYTNIDTLSVSDTNSRTCQQKLTRH